MSGLAVTVSWRNGAIHAIEVAMEQPRPAGLLPGLPTDVALSVLERLYSVCGQAQRACAELATAVADDRPLRGDRQRDLARRVALEALKEHLWRLLLDWPAKLGVAARPELLQRWYRWISLDEPGWPARLEGEFADLALGCPLSRPDGWRDLAEFDAWCVRGGAPLPEMFARLQAEEAGRVAVADPHSGGPDHPWLAALVAAGRALEASVGARLVAAISIVTALAAGAPPPVEMDAATPSPGEGIAVVDTARGMLRHTVRVSHGRIADYDILTPTDVHFAPHGVLSAGLTGCPAGSLEAACRLVDVWTLALDPCVAYRVVPQPERAHA